MITGMMNIMTMQQMHSILHHLLPEAHWTEWTSQQEQHQLTLAVQVLLLQPFHNKEYMIHGICRLDIHTYIIKEDMIQDTGLREIVWISSHLM